MKTPDRFERYLSLGDSISIDLYPGLDVAEREGLPSPPDGLGAASLLHRNDDERWPSYEGRDLTRRWPGLEHVDLCADGATTVDVLERQLPAVADRLEDPTLVTLTAGGNDLLALIDPLPRPLAWLFGRSSPGGIGAVVRRLEEAVEEVSRRLERGLVLVGTVYDPTDGTGRLQGLERPEGLELLHELNQAIRALDGRPGVRAVDIHDHFRGHGVAEPDPGKRWYWRHSIIEPSARGAHEVRRLWWEALAD